MHLRFASLWMAWLLAPLYLTFVGLWYYQRRPSTSRLRTRGVLRFGTTQVLAGLPEAPAVRHRRLAQLLRPLTVALFAIALLRPQSALNRTDVIASGIDIVLAIDTSMSMKALDLDADKPIAKRRDRLQVVKSVVAEFIGQRDSDLIGLVVFGGEAYTQCPLTLDHNVIDVFLSNVQPGMAGENTAIGSGIGTAINRLRRSTGKSKIIILLTDGRNNAGDLSPKKAAEMAHAMGIKIYTIGAGGQGPAPYLVQTPFGSQVVTDNVDIDESTLKEVAELTGGAYFRAEDVSGLTQIYKQIDALEKTPVKAPTYMETHEQFAWVLVPALMLLFAEVVLLATRLSKIP